MQAIECFLVLMNILDVFCTECALFFFYHKGRPWSANNINLSSTNNYAKITTI
jgi:hypothetical protein